MKVFLSNNADVTALLGNFFYLNEDGFKINEISITLEA